MYKGLLVTDVQCQATDSTRLLNPHKAFNINFDAVVDIVGIDIAVFGHSSCERINWGFLKISLMLNSLRTLKIHLSDLDVANFSKILAWLAISLDSSFKSALYRYMATLSKKSFQDTWQILEKD